MLFHMLYHLYQIKCFQLHHTILFLIVEHILNFHASKIRHLSEPTKLFTKKIYPYIFIPHSRTPVKLWAPRSAITLELPDGITSKIKFVKFSATFLQHAPTRVHGSRPRGNRVGIAASPHLVHSARGRKRKKGFRMRNPPLKNMAQNQESFR